MSPPVRAAARLLQANSRPVAGREVGLAPRHDTVTFVVSDGGTEGGGSRAELRSSLPVYDLQVTVFPVDSQPPSLAAGRFHR